MIAFADRRAFWFGIVAVSIGVVLHLPMYIGAADMGYELAGMPMDPSMKAGMALIVAGLVLSAYGVVPRGARADPDRVAGLRVAALDEAPVQRAHLALLAVMAAAVTIDVMKPTTLAFVVPGMAQEYGLKSPLNPQGQVPVALLPLCALIGMVLGSAGWGWLGDRIGRRASILLAAGRVDEAEAVMARFGARLVREDPVATSAEEPGRYAQLFRRPFGGLTTAVVLFGLGWGLVNSGFLLWLPTNLRQLGLETGAAERLLAGAAIIGFPAVFAVALLYGFWSSKRTMIGVVLLTSATLFTFVALGRRVGDHPYLLQALIVLLLVGTNSILAVLTPYSSEVYPTRVRARGTGLAGACARGGGLLGVSVVVIGLAPRWPPWRSPATGSRPVGGGWRRSPRASWPLERRRTPLKPQPEGDPWTIW